MLEKTAHVKNPLTIIAVFAGIAEVSGTIVTPLLLPAQQSIFIWFLIFFPILLIVLFFLTLNFNPKVLYAPSDFKNEDNFLTVHKYNVVTQQTEAKSISVELPVIADIPKYSASSIHINESSLLAQVTNFHDAQDFVTQLNELGYPSAIYRSEGEVSLLEGHESIWVGQHVAPKIVVSILKLAIKNYPHLKYMHLSGDGGEPPEEIHYRMYIGGSTDTSKSYGIRAFSEKEIQGLSEDLSKSELHKFIRSYY